MDEAPQTVIETEPFLKCALDLWTEGEHLEFVDFIARNCLVGVEIPGTGGLRKVRWSRAGMGKRGGVRVIYYYCNNAEPLYLLAAYAKSQKEDLSPQEKTILRKVVEELKKQIRDRHKAKRS